MLACLKGLTELWQNFGVLTGVPALVVISDVYRGLEHHPKLISHWPLIRSVSSFCSFSAYLWTARYRGVAAGGGSDLSKLLLQRSVLANPAGESMRLLARWG
jgi:hypothetical protein